jgi:hypothetical protein
MNARFTTPIAKTIMATLLAAATIATALPLEAMAAPGYKPPNRSGAKRTAGTGSRSGNVTRVGNLKDCAKDLAVPMTLLMPEEVAQTSIARPPLFVYLTGKKNITVSFDDLSGSKPKALWTRSMSIEEPGFVRVDYPTEEAELATGKTYAWNVEIVCEDASTTSRVMAKLERVQPSSYLQTQLSKATTDQRKADLYASSGFWVDTLSVTGERLGTDESAQKDLLSLITQIGLKSIADREQ